tara:strand:- start:1191 stop:2048 length:858 start_codon:yes stop_codon:yes gene_type:complete
MFSKSLLLSLGITSLASIAIYFYFTQRIKKNEQKMDLIFDIIQEHKKTTEIIYERLNNVPHSNGNNNGLINVSDTEPNHNSGNQQNTEAVDDETDDESDYTDSEVVSDNESIKSLKIKNEENLQQDTLNLQELPFNINGADSTNTSEAMMMMMGSIQLGQNLFENTEENNDQVEIEYVSEDTHEENNIENLETTEIIQETLSEENVQLHNELPIEEPVINDIENDIENETASEISNVTASNIEADVDIHNPKTTVAQLKALAKSKNLRYRGLRKDKLVELLDNNM